MLGPTSEQLKCQCQLSILQRKDAHLMDENIYIASDQLEFLTETMINYITYV